LKALMDEAGFTNIQIRESLGHPNTASIVCAEKGKWEK